MNQNPLWLIPLLENKKITDICFNGHDEIFFDSGHGLLPYQNGKFQSQEELREWLLRTLSDIGKTWDAKHPFINARLKIPFRIHVVFPPICEKGVLVSLRRLAETENNPSSLKRWNHSPFFSKLVEITQSGESLLIAGSTGSGKTTLLSDLISSIPHHQRIIALEDTPELQLNHPQIVSLQSRQANADGYGEVTLKELLKQCLRMRPDRIILGECRGSEVLELLQTLNTGHRGAMATLHANSCREAIKRIELLCLLSSVVNLSQAIVQELLSIGIQWIAFLKKENNGEREIKELYKIEGKEQGSILLRPYQPSSQSDDLSAYL